MHHLDEIVQSMPRIGEIDREATRLYVEQHFSAQVIAENYAHIYQQVIAMSKEKVA